MEESGFRKDLNGLRALSVALVVIYHAGVMSLGGGYVGVDAFFVLSGYFMTSLILRDIASERFSFVEFYTRRARRILPALFAMVLVTSVFAYLFLMPEELKYYARSVRATALFYSNIQFSRESGYFDIGSQLKPLLHTWSLSVEEQFYVIFPILLFVVYRLRSRAVLPVLVAVTVLSFTASEFVVHSDQTGAFFGLPYRLWELMLGGLAVSIGRRPNQFGCEVITAIGIILLLSSALFYTDLTPVPGVASLIPCIGALFIIISGRDSRLAAVLLGNPFCQFIGKISYSVYLWHWPIIIFEPYIVSDLSPWARVALVLVLSVGFGWASWKFVEQPFRFQFVIGKKPVAALGCYLVVAGGFVSVSEVVIDANGLPNRLSDRAARLYAAKSDASPFFRPQCFGDPDGNGLTPADVDQDKVCLLGSSGQPEFVLWGDSHAGSLASSLDAAAKRSGRTGIFVGNGGCPPFASSGLLRPDRVKRCDDFNASVEAMIIRLNISDVVLAAYWRKYLSIRDGTESQLSAKEGSVQFTDVRSRLADNVMRLNDLDTKVWLMLDIPDFAQPVPERLARLATLSEQVQISLPISEVNDRQGAGQNLVREVGRQANARIVDPTPWLCDAHVCNAVSGETVLYKDGDHLTQRGALLISKMFDPVLAQFTTTR